MILQQLLETDTQFTKQEFNKLLEVQSWFVEQMYEDGWRCVIKNSNLFFSHINHTKAIVGPVSFHHLDGGTNLETEAELKSIFKQISCFQYKARGFCIKCKFNMRNHFITLKNRSYEAS